ncbi:ABC transporter permease [Halomonas sp. E19]|uniref:ABC transporter permease n=1 Tax=Halomonas sp. E19 TaxID=3397247 RepID=UPI004034BFD5
MKATPLASWAALPLLLALWWLLAWQLDTSLLPTPSAVLATLQQEAASGELQRHLAVTLRRVALSFALAMALGCLVGIAMGRLALVNALLDPLLVLLLNLPALVLIILLYVWFGLVEAAAIMAVVINKIPNVAVTLREGARSLDPRLEQMARIYDFSTLRRLWHVWCRSCFLT